MRGRRTILDSSLILNFQLDYIEVVLHGNLIKESSREILLFGTNRRKGFLGLRLDLPPGSICAFTLLTFFSNSKNTKNHPPHFQLKAYGPTELLDPSDYQIRVIYSVLEVF